MSAKKKRSQRIKRHKKVRGKISGTGKIPRLCVFRSGKHIYAQLIDDEKNKVLASASDFKIKVKKVKVKKSSSDDKKERKQEPLSSKLSVAFEVGKVIAKKAKELKIESIVFDRGGYKYHGRVKALADGAREEGLKF
ncbi:MAG: 50S ribosomal protein L18 [Candidatus Nealsonbacteria bacterium]